MVPWTLVARRAIKFAPIAIEVARQLDRQMRPHVLAYRLARDVDGYVGRWTGEKGTHWVVFARPEAGPLRVFPPASDTESADIQQEMDRSALRHHSELPEARLKDTTDRVVKAPGQVVGLLRRGDDEAAPETD